VIDERDAAIARAEKGEKYFQEMAEQISTLCRDPGARSRAPRPGSFPGGRTVGRR
jgi:creatinine amidohydrolase/Fe(II)-dependent formamide hydrolase-like protein